MTITKNSVVQFHYVLRDEDDNNNEIENSRDASPILYLHGHKNIVAGLEEALLGKNAGDTLSVSLTPEQAYGARRENSIQRVPVKHLLVAKKARLQAGMLVHIQTDQGAVPALIVKAGKFTVDVDTNHPLAGKNLGFDIEVISVREGTEEEIAHGHAHGEGGHQH